MSSDETQLLAAAAGVQLVRQALWGEQLVWAQDRESIGSRAVSPSVGKVNARSLLTSPAVDPPKQGAIIPMDGQDPETVSSADVSQSCR